ncbi:hypothetical protein FA13DRAFT_1735506 [Coprinellus micaceus]|uniref:Uncharacterized protein n=1 Tax=Coprinellus micaceus TaxID=71717 RepID=A0A4Y7T542_COPMI|nr:hypothetical protein FA13DRAFT_1735506 [Coprinellus micaceus]
MERGHEISGVGKNLMTLTQLPVLRNPYWLPPSLRILGAVESLGITLEGFAAGPGERAEQNGTLSTTWKAEDDAYLSRLILSCRCIRRMPHLRTRLENPLIEEVDGAKPRERDPLPLNTSTGWRRWPGERRYAIAACRQAEKRRCAAIRGDRRRQCGAWC